MSENQLIEMSKIIGQIEDELRDIKSAKMQVENVIGSNKKLSDSLQALFESASKVSKTVENNSQQIITTITKKLETLNIQASDIDSYTKKCVTKINEQSTLMQSKLEDDLGSLVDKLMNTISNSTNQSLEDVENELTEYRTLIHEAVNKFIDSSSDAIRKQESQTVEIIKLVESIQERQCSLDSKIEELRELDILHIFDEIREIREIESDNASAIKKLKIIELRGFGISILLGIVILIRLFAT